MSRRWTAALTGAPTGALAAALLAAACAGRPPAAFSGAAHPGDGLPVPRLELLGEAELPSGLQLAGTRVGGLSGLAYDAGRGVYYALSDDPSSHGPARFYTLRIELASGSLAADGVTLLGVTPLRDRSGLTFAELTVDPEGIALTERDTLVISSEGQVERGVGPFVAEFGLDGRLRRPLRLPHGGGLASGGRRGVRHNLAYESLTLAAEEGAVYTASENALLQDGPAADLDRRSPVRLLRLGWPDGRLEAAYLLWIEPVPAPPRPEGAFRVNGLVELLSLAPGELLALERSFSAGVGHGARLYWLRLVGATDVRRRPTLAGADCAAAPAAGCARAVRKQLVLDLADLAPRLRGALDNLEAMTWGPALADGRRTLVLASDDNFDPRQRTQFLAFAVDR